MQNDEMSDLEKKIQTKAIGIVNNFFSKYITILESYPESEFADGGYLLYVFKSEYEQFPIEISKLTKPMVLPVFVGNVGMYNQPFINKTDMIEKIKQYYYKLLCNIEKIRSYIDYINSEEYEEYHELEGGYKGDFDSEPANDALFNEIIGANSAFAIEFSYGFDLSPICPNS